MLTQLFRIAPIVVVLLFLTACRGTRTVTQETSTSAERLSVETEVGAFTSTDYSFRAKFTPCGNLLVLTPDTAAPVWVRHTHTQYQNSDTSKTSISNSDVQKAESQKKVGEPLEAVRPSSLFRFIVFLVFIPVAIIIAVKVLRLVFS